MLKGARSIRLVNLLGAYQGPYVVLDFDEQEILVGIEIVGEDRDEDEDKRQPER
ncbi:hypothetical protein [Sorangium sp. So ce513]|uniref:hypothetical protein n=1 Tax=Sorangium sp. So ce513 TaxID=3133315 RepID=UPI003F61CC34